VECRDSERKEGPSPRADKHRGTSGSSLNGKLECNALAYRSKPTSATSPEHRCPLPPDAQAEMADYLIRERSGVLTTGIFELAAAANTRGPITEREAATMEKSELHQHQRVVYFGMETEAGVDALNLSPARLRNTAKYFNAAAEWHDRRRAPGA